MAMQNLVNLGLLHLKEICKDKGFQNNQLLMMRIGPSVCYHPPEILTSLVALDLIGNLLDEETKSKIMTWLQPKEDAPLVGIKSMYPNDPKLRPQEIDVTAYFMSTFLERGLIEKDDQLKDLAQILIDNVNEDGVMQIFLPPRGEREGYTDATVCCNVMRLLYALGLEEKAKASEDYIFNFLESKAFLESTLEYISPDIFLLFLIRAIAHSAKAKERFLGPITTALRDRLGSTKYPIDVSARILVLDALGMLSDPSIKKKLDADKRELKSAQDEKGVFKNDALFKKDRLTAFYGGDAVATIFGVAALNCFAVAEKLKYSQP